MDKLCSQYTETGFKPWKQRNSELGETDAIQGTEETSTNIFKNFTEIRNYIVSSKQRLRSCRKEALKDQERSELKKKYTFVKSRFKDKAAELFYKVEQNKDMNRKQKIK